MVGFLDEYADPLDDVIFFAEEALPNPREGHSPLGAAVAAAVRAEIGGVPVEPERSFTVAIAEYVLAEVPFLAELPSSDTGLRVDTILEDFLREGGLASVRG